LQDEGEVEADFVVRRPTVMRKRAVFFVRWCYKLVTEVTSPSGRGTNGTGLLVTRHGESRVTEVTSPLELGEEMTGRIAS
jgi:hypothetical protein